MAPKRKKLYMGTSRRKGGSGETGERNKDDDNKIKCMLGKENAVRRKEKARHDKIHYTTRTTWLRSTRKN